MTEQQDDAPPGVTRRRRSASLTEYMALLVIQLAAVTVIMFAVGTWINTKWTILNSALP
ncbi:MAG: Flp family type IVb pilin [Methyloceanibacter sp.]